MIIFAQLLLPGAGVLVGVDEKIGLAGISGLGEADAGDLVALVAGEPGAGDLSGDIGAAFCGVSRNCAILG